MSLPIQVYVLAPIEQILGAWLNERIGPSREVDSFANTTIYEASSPPVSISVTPDIEGTDFVGLWINGEELPWADERQCAFDAANTLGAAVRFATPAEGEGSTFLEVSPQGEATVSWLGTPADVD